MPRRARMTVPGIPHHVIQRGNNRQACFIVMRTTLLTLNGFKSIRKILHAMFMLMF